MLASLESAAVIGIQASPVHVEVDLCFGLPRFQLVGLPDASVRESRDRVHAAIRNSGFEFPQHRIVINLAPADVRKAGASYDLPIALGVLAASGVVTSRDIRDIVIVGELALDGTIHPARGVLPIAVAARQERAEAMLLPQGNTAEAAVVEGLRLLPVRTLAEAVALLNLAREQWPSSPPAPAPPPAGEYVLDLADLRGQLFARRALEVAAAGGHNLLMLGPPGAGKTMLARRMPSILPPLLFEEALEATAIHSVAGLIPPGAGLLAERPFRAPHHTISDAALVGGGAQPRPGEVSLAHHGVLFLDEMPEFERRVLDAMRQPLEEGRITVSRAARSVVFPARFMLVAAMNPCPCGYLGGTTRPCRCTPAQVAKYRSRISGPLRDRIDLIVEVDAVPISALGNSGPSGEPSAAVRGRVAAARQRQAARNGTLNARLPVRALGRSCGLSAGGRGSLDAFAERLQLSARAYHRVLRVSRTIADLAASECVADEHLAEALQYRFVE
ncbi:MAG TPA: YifB family Mg chelatase-like AAA ATPase [Vicinamibacterales bacterium]|nr:YifB family Mg chelatase-like AAA ATPase [Vicinamibacterales bacterium]